VVLNSQLSLRDIQPGVPDNVKPAVAIAARVLLTQFKRFPKQKDFGFTLELDPNKFDLTQTEDLDRLWQQFKQATVAALLKTTGLKQADLPEGTNEKMDATVDIVTKGALKALEKIKERRKAKKAAKEALQKE
jgi:hypothetical protein